jgi:hypothetical protein
MCYRKLDKDVIAAARNIASQYSFEVVLAAYAMMNIERAKDFVIDNYFDDSNYRPSKSDLIENACNFALEVSPIMMTDEECNSLEEYIQAVTDDLVTNNKEFHQLNIPLR